MAQVQQSQFQILQTVSASLELAIAALEWQLDLLLQPHMTFVL